MELEAENGCVTAPVTMLTKSGLPPYKIPTTTSLAGVTAKLQPVRAPAPVNPPPERSAICLYWLATTGGIVCAFATVAPRQRVRTNNRATQTPAAPDRVEYFGLFPVFCIEFLRKSVSRMRATILLRLFRAGFRPNGPAPTHAVFSVTRAHTCYQSPHSETLLSVTFLSSAALRVAQSNFYTPVSKLIRL